MQHKRIKRRIDGVLLLNKPVGITSNAALQIAKRLYQAEKAGHTGTLDPFASGLLPLCFGEATKFSQYQLHADKAYRAVLQLGVTTTTGDPEGCVLETRPVNVSAAQIDAAITQFIGAIEQTPPMYSALKHQGKPLYEYARAGIEIERKARPVHIRSIKLIDREMHTLTLDVVCSAGTYIRTLAESIGAVLGCGAHLIALTRTASGGFTLAQAASLPTLENASMAARDTHLMSADGLVSYLPKIIVSANEAAALRQGQRPLLSAQPAAAALMRAYDITQQFLGLIEVQAGGLAVVQRLMNTAKNDF